MLTWGGFGEEWNTFFFSPQPLVALSTFRILFGLIIALDGLLS